MRNSSKGGGGRRYEGHPARFPEAAQGEVDAVSLDELRLGGLMGVGHFLARTISGGAVTAIDVEDMTSDE
jgi:hypothetical protein